MGSIEFYNVKKRAKVSIDESTVTKVVYTKTTVNGEQKRYAFRAQDDDGVNLTKFCSKVDFDASSAKEGTV